MNRTLLLAALLAAPLGAQNAYCIDTYLDTLYSVDLLTGAFTPIGSTYNNGLDTPADLCWRDDTNEIWTIDFNGGEVGTIDPLTGTFTVVWNTGLSLCQAMAWDHTSKQFYLHNQNDVLYRLDPATGALTAVGSLNPTTPLITALECDATGQLWALDYLAGTILAIDKNTGLQSAPIATSVNNFQCLTIDRNGVWYGINTTSDGIYVINPTTGACSVFGFLLGTLVKGLVVTGSAVQRGGNGCPDGAGAIRRMTWSGGSNLGNSLSLGCEPGPTPTFNFVAYGLSAQAMGPLALPLDLGSFGAPGCRLYQSTDLIVGGTATGTQVAFAMPTNPAFVAATVFAQCVILDASPSPNALGLVLSDVAKFTVTN